MECIIAKIFGSEAQKEAAIELFMKTHGGRSFLHGHLFGDNVHEYLAPCIYEGEGEMLGMALLQVAGQAARQDSSSSRSARRWQRRASRSRTRSTRRTPGRCEGVAGRTPSGWSAQTLRPQPRPQLPDDARRRCASTPSSPSTGCSACAARDQRHDEQASAGAGRPAVPHGGALAARAGRWSSCSCTSLYAARQTTKSSATAADVLCQDLTRKLDRPAPERPLLPRGHQARRSDRRRRLQVDRRPPRRTRS